LLLPLALRWGEQSGAGLARALEVVSAAPGRVLGVAGAGRLAAGSVADLCVFDPRQEWQVRPEALLSQGKHTPFAGHALQGRVRCTLVGGRVVHQQHDAAHD
jgi:dihydroorotase